MHRRLFRMTSKRPQNIPVTHPVTTGLRIEC